MRTMKKQKSKLPDFEKRARAFFPKQRHGQGAPLLLIFDGMNIAYQAFHGPAYKRFSYMGKKTSIPYGMPSIIGGILKAYTAQKVIVCWDGKRHPERLRRLPDYKGHRAERPKSFSRQIKKTRQLLYRLGIAQAYNPNMEGDDMIYWVWKKYSPLYRIVIVTADKDLHQLINYDTTIYNPRTKTPYSNFAYICDHLVEPYQYVDYLCLLGDSSDDIPGYTGIGPARASAFFANFKGIKEYLASSREWSGMLDKEKVEKIWKRNRMLIDLRRFNEKYHKDEDFTFYKDKRNPEFQKEKFDRLALSMGMVTLTKTNFQDPFKRLSEL